MTKPKSQIDPIEHKRFVEAFREGRTYDEIISDLKDRNIDLAKGTLWSFFNNDYAPTKKTLDKLLSSIDNPIERQELRERAYKLYGFYAELEETRLAEELCKKAIELQLYKKGIKFEECQEHSTGHFDWGIKPDDNHIKRWWFETKVWQESNQRSLDQYWQITTNIFIPITDEEKVSLVVNNSRVYKYIKERTTYEEGPFPYRGDCSIVLIDTDRVKVIEEHYISHYYLEPKKQHELLLK